MATKDFSKILLGEGKLVKDFGETGELDLGYTRGGEFTMNSTLRHIMVDGKKGHIKGDAVREEDLPQLDFTAVQFDASVLEETFYNMTVTDNSDGTATVTFSNENPVDADYHTNISYVGETKDGTQVVVKLLNALAEGSMNFTLEDRSEVEIPCMFTANYASIDDTEVPVEITMPYEDSVQA